MYRIFLLSSAAIAMSACSMNGADSFYGSGLVGQTQHSSAYSQGCQVNNCGAANPYAVGQAPQAHAGYGYAPTHHAASYGATRPDAHAYGSQVHGGHYAQNHHGAPQLRGRHNVRQGYKYGTLGAVMYDVDDSVFGVQGRIGYQSAHYIGAELEGSLGVIGDSETIGTTEFDSSIKHSFAGFGVGRLPVTDRVTLLGRAGYHNTKAKLEVDDGTTVTEGTNTVVGFAYGAGAEYAVNTRDSIRLDYTRYEADTGGALDSVSLAFARKF